MVYKLIPKKIHLVWNHRYITDSKHPLITFGIRQLIDLNPDWEVTVYVPSDIESDLQSALTPEDYALVKERHFVSKIDLWRLFKMYHEGGLYVDIDRLCNKSLSTIIDENTQWVCPTSGDFDVTCDFLLSAPFNPVFLNGIKLYIQRLREGHTSQYFLGPQTYMHAVTLTLCGELINTNPGVEKMNYIRDRIRQLPFAKTYKELPPSDTILYSGPLGEKLEELKRDFYASENVKHWTGEW
jgi:hypothetical protein